MRNYFARHGESQANLLHLISTRGPRHGLTRRGREQAGALAQRLQGIPIARIYSSPVLRAVETSVTWPIDWTSMMLPLLSKNVDTDLIAQHGFEHAACIVAEWRSTGLYCADCNGQTVDEDGNHAQRTTDA